MNKSVMQRIGMFALASLCMLGVVACSNSKKEDEAYKQSKTLPPLEVPPDLIKPTADASTAIPDLPARPSATAAPTPVPVPVPGGAIHVEKQGALRWLVVPTAPEQTQQRVKEFLLQLGFSIAKEAAGTLETEWRGGEGQPANDNDLDAALKSGLRDKLKLRIEAGRDNSGSEVSVSHVGLQRVVVEDKQRWQPRPADPILEAEVLEQLRAFLMGEAAAVEPVSDLPAVRTQISTDAQGAATLKVDEDFERAWRRVGIALGRGGFVVEDRNRSEGVYLIRIGQAFKEDAKAGFLSRLFGGNTTPEDQYRIALKEQGGFTAVVVQYAGGGLIHLGIGERILEKIEEKMP